MKILVYSSSFCWKTIVKTLVLENLFMLFMFFISLKIMRKHKIMKNYLLKINKIKNQFDCQLSSSFSLFSFTHR